MCLPSLLSKLIYFALTIVTVCYVITGRLKITVGLHTIKYSDLDYVLYSKYCTYCHMETL